MFDKKSIRNKKIALFGTGLDAVKCLYFFAEKKTDIVYCLNNNCKDTEFCGYSVYEPKAERLKDIFLFVATRREVYPVISRQLQESGLTEFQDYIYYEWIYKKLVLLHGNCHMAVIKSYLQSSDIFCKYYSIYPNPLICQNSNGKVEEVVLKNCDVWIHEDIRADNEFGFFLSDEHMRNFIRNDTFEIVIPHLFGLGKAFFPQSGWNKRNRKIKNGEDANGMFPYADKVIDGCVEQGMDKKRIIEFCMSMDAISVSDVIENFESYIDKMRKREENWHIKIVDYILKNYKDKRLFYDMGHPTNDIMKKISTEILEKLGIKDKSIHTDECMDAHEEPVYPVVKNVLDMNWENKFIRQSNLGKKACDQMDFREYIEEYLWWCFGIL